MKNRVAANLDGQCPLFERHNHAIGLLLNREDGLRGPVLHCECAILGRHRTKAIRTSEKDFERSWRIVTFL